MMSEKFFKYSDEAKEMLMSKPANVETLPPPVPAERIDITEFKPINHKLDSEPSENEEE